mmetsp:Transcript_6960/g.12905  ORF Transcript_6960/g.12905 Transcript_6960/m.12905 type:complete len:412 (-) Transcript_6960:1213-2448(-)
MQNLCHLLAILLLGGESLTSALSTRYYQKKMAAISSTSLSTSKSSSVTANDLQVIPSLRHIVDEYDVFLLDMWGVMHDGEVAYEGVLDLVKELKRAKRDMIILSNSSKRQDNSIKMLLKLGFDPDDFSKIITSGEVSHHLLNYLASSPTMQEGISKGKEISRSAWVPSVIPSALLELSSSLTSRRAFCFGSGDGDEEYLASCGWTLADTVENADLLVARGTFVVLDANSCADKKVGEEAYWQAYHQALERAAQKGIPMVVANPDKIRPDADMSPMPGTIGVHYQQLLERNGNRDSSSLVLCIGKPFADVYEIALRDCPGKRACMVGDALETDVTGANAAGIDSVWVVNNGIHSEEIANKASDEGVQRENDSVAHLRSGCEAVLRDFNKESETTYAKGQQLSPTFVMPTFRW